MDTTQPPLRIELLRAAQRACLVAGLLASGTGCAPELQAGCHGGLTECGGVCVDIASDAAHCGACGHDCLGGECGEGACQPVLLSTGPARAFDVALDGTSIYWTSQGAAGTSTGEVRKISRIASGAATVLASGQPAPRGMAVDAVNVYWTNSGGDTVMMAPKAGGEPVVLATEQAARDMAVDDTHVYWTNTTGEVMKAPIDMSDDPTVLVDGPAGPDGIALDAAHVYWVNRNNGQVSKVPIDDPGAAPTVLLTGPLEATDLVVDDTHVYWSSYQSGKLLKIALDGSESSETVIAQGQASPFGLAVDASYVYWVTYNGHEVKRAPRNGGAEVVLAALPMDEEGLGPGPRRIVVDDAAIYWTNHDYGELMMLAK